MKHPFLVFIFLRLIGISVNAQPYQGNIGIVNETDCDIYYDIIAVCPGPPCQEYSKEAFHLIPSHGSASYSFDDYPWHGEEPPPCADWSWSYALISLDVGGESCMVPVGVGLNGASCNPYDNLTLLTCQCNGENVWADFSILPNGFIQLRISY
jgi:hypothetical protein